MYAIFNRSALTFELASDVRLLDGSCVASSYGNDMAMISTNYRNCNTEMKVRGIGMNNLCSAA